MAWIYKIWARDSGFHYIWRCQATLLGVGSHEVEISQFDEVPVLRSLGV